MNASYTANKEGKCTRPKIYLVLQELKLCMRRAQERGLAERTDMSRTERPGRIASYTSTEARSTQQSCTLPNKQESIHSTCPIDTKDKENTAGNGQLLAETR